MMTKEEIQTASIRHNAKLFYCGLLSGVIAAGVFNPYDRALYLSLIENRPFLHRLNFKNPMSGLMQSLVQRTLSGGLYFPLEEIFRGVLKDYFHESTAFANMLAGTLAGGTNGLILSPASTVKYKVWGLPDNAYHHSFLRMARQMYRRGGWTVFLKGASTTLWRDILFGGVYGFFRYELMGYCANASNGDRSSVTSSEKYLVNSFSAAFATFVSSPLNYVRNMQYAGDPSQPMESCSKLLKELYQNTRQQPSLWNKSTFLQHQLRLGWGTVRVGIGMAFSEQIYSFCSKSI